MEYLDRARFGNRLTEGGENVHHDIVLQIKYMKSHQAIAICSIFLMIPGKDNARKDSVHFS